MDVNPRSPYECYWSRRALAAEEKLKSLYPEPEPVLELEVVKSEPAEEKHLLVAEVGYIKGAHSYSTLSKAVIRQLAIEPGDELDFSGVGGREGLFKVKITSVGPCPNSENHLNVCWRII